MVRARQYEGLELVLGAVVGAGGCVQHVEHDRRIEPCLLADGQHLAGDPETRRGGEVVQRLHRLAGAQRTGAEDRAGHRLEHRCGTPAGLRVAAQHDREVPFAGPCHVAGDGRIDHRHTGGIQPGADASGDRRFARGHVDQQRAGGQATGHRRIAFALAEQQALQVGAGGQHRDHHRAAPGHRHGAARRCNLVLERQPGHHFGAKVEADDLDARLAQRDRHRFTHGAQADETDRRGHHRAPISSSTSRAALVLSSAAGTPQ